LTQVGIHFREAQGPRRMRLYAIGDVHGRLDLLVEMHRRIAADIEQAAERPDWRIVHLGDYVDRGPDSKGVIDFLIAATERDPRNIVLAGNHDACFLDFLARPDIDSVFARHGGRQTARSYGVDLDLGSEESMRHGWIELTAAMPDRHMTFLRGLSYSASLGDFFFCHAGIRPGVPLDRQSPDDLIWIRQIFHDHTGLYEKIVVHGHTPVPAPEVLANRVNVDTFAWQSGRLTALAIDGADKRILTVTGKAAG